MESEVEAVEAAEASINGLIERQALSATEREAWDASARRYAAQADEALRNRWAEHHRHMAEVHSGLADEHYRKLEELQKGATQ